MALDTRIPLMVQSPQIESPLNRYGRVMQLRNMKQQGQLNQIQIDAAERQQRTAEQVRNALAAAQSAGKSPEEVVNDIMMIDPAAAEPFLRATKLQAQTGQATALTDKYKAQREETLRKIMRDRFVPIMTMQDPAMQQQAYQAWRQESIAIDPDDESVLPEQFDPRLGQAIMDSADAFMDRNTISATDAAKLEQGERKLAETERYHTGRLAQGPATRGDTVETALLKQGLKPVYNEQGEIVEMTSIPGSKSDPKTQQQTQEIRLTAKEKAARDKAFPKVRALVTKFEANTDDLIKKLTVLKDHKGLKAMTGYMQGRLGQWNPDGDARDADALFRQIMATGQFGELSALKQESAVGSSGLGSASNLEQQGLRDKFSALGSTLEYDDFRDNIDDTINQLEASKKRIRDQFELDYEYALPESGSDEWGVVE